jgi:hypothetical protein
MGGSPVPLDLPSAEAVRLLKARYFRFIDLKQWAQLTELFTPDATFEGLWAAAGDPIAFVANLERNLGPDVITVHHGFMPELTQVAADRIHGVWAMTDYLTWRPGSRDYLGVRVEGQRGVYGYGHYEEEYTLVGDGWRIARLRLTRIRIDPIIGPELTVDYPFLPSH